MTHVSKSPASVDALGQRGYTLVELMIGLLISLFMIAVTVGYMVSSSRSFTVQSNDAFSSENARFAFEYLSQNIRQAGRDRTNDIAINLDVIYNGNRCPNADGRSIVAGDNSPCTVDEFAFNSDRFAVDYIVDEPVSACNGFFIDVFPGAKLRIADVFWTDDIDGDGVRSLYCQPLNLDANVPVGQATPIIDGVDRLQIQYGADILDVGEAEGDSDGFINSYQSYRNLISANPANPTAATRQVRAVRIALLMSSGVPPGQDGRDVNTESFADKTYTLLDGPPITIAQDRVFRQVYTSTVLLPNNI